MALFLPQSSVTGPIHHSRRRES